MMIIINRTETLISGAINGEPFNVSYDEQKYALMKDLELQATKVNTIEELQAIVKELMPLTKESYKEIVQTACPDIFVNKHTNKFYLQCNNKISSKAIPQALVDRILLSVEKGIEVKPLIKCWMRFLRETPGRPAFTDARATQFANYIMQTYTNEAVVANLVSKEGFSRETAVIKATTPQVAITLEGLLVGYKVSREILTKYDLNENEEVVTKSRYKKSVDPDTGKVTYDEAAYVEERLFEPCVMGNRGDEFWCVGTDINGVSYSKKGHHIRVGALHYLDNWDQVSSPGNKGLHCGGLSYIDGYQQEGTVTHNILIDPADIHSTNCHGEGVNGAMTVKRYFVHSSFAGVNKNIYHSSKYAEMNDEEYKKVLEEVVTKTQMSKTEMDNALDEAMALS
jgi:hypothetical protein